MTRIAMLIALFALISPSAAYAAERPQATLFKNPECGCCEEYAKYLRRNREHMRYDEYLRQGLPIASGCVEGACKNLIKDRMERSGMRWSLTGAEAMIQLRSLYLSGDLDDYWDFHLEQEHRRLYPLGRWEVVEE